MSENKSWITHQLCIAQASFTCNLYCKYCHNPPQFEKRDLSDIVKLVKKESPDAVSLEGQGEPLINNDILKIIKEIKKLGVKHIMISTNGLALSDIKLARMLKDEVEFFVINFPSHIKDVYNSLTRSVKYELIVKALDNLKNLDILYKVRLFHIITTENYKDLGNLVDWVKRHYSGIFLLNFCFVRNKGRVREYPRDIMPRYSDVSKYLKLALARSKLYGIKAITQNIPLCAIENFEGFAFEFHRWKRGDPVFERGVEKPLNIEVCRRCSVNKACCGARRDYVEVYGKSELKALTKNLESIKPERF